MQPCFFFSSFIQRHEDSSQTWLSRQVNLKTDTSHDNSEALTCTDSQWNDSPDTDNKSNIINVASSGKEDHSEELCIDLQWLSPLSGPKPAPEQTAGPPRWRGPAFRMCAHPFVENMIAKPAPLFLRHWVPKRALIFVMRGRCSAARP